MDPPNTSKLKNKDISDEAEVPVPFDYFPVEDTIPSKAQQPSHPCPQCEDFGDEIPDPQSLPPLRYDPLDTSTDEVRLLLVSPHHGNASSTIVCGFVHTSLEQHQHFAAIRNSRGNAALTSLIIVDRSAMRVTQNLHAFLHHVRRPDHALLLWVREICINREDLEERSAQLNAERINYIYYRACKILHMNLVMEELKDKGLLERDWTVREKQWTTYPTTAPNMPKHWPIELGQLRGTDEPPLPFKYVPLDLLAEEIRVVVVAPDGGDPTSSLTCGLGYIPMYGESIYECLSYTWGDITQTAEIMLAGQAFAVPKNLESALRGLRHPETHVNVWVDAISIDQDNIRERNREVGRMHKIYEAAAGVLIWIGDGDEDSDRAMDFAKELGEPEWKAFEETEEGNDIKRTPRLALAWESMYRLFNRLWFSRTWVAQELATASVPTVACEKKLVSFYYVHNAALGMMLHWRSICEDLWEGKVPPGEYAMTNLVLVHRMAYYRHLRSTGRSVSLLQLALTNILAESTDPRDKLYALWNLASDKNKLSHLESETHVPCFQPDYNKSVKQVYVDFVKAYVHSRDSLDVICAARLPQRQELPSWVPDWSFPHRIDPFAHLSDVPILDWKDYVMPDAPRYRASRNTRCATGFFFDDSTLVCAGLSLDVVEEVGERAAGMTPPASWEIMAKSLTQCDGVPVTQEEIEYVFKRTLNADPSPSAYPASSASHADEEVSSGTEVGGIGPRTSLAREFSGRCFITTQRGFMGLAPFNVEKGLEVCVLLGCSVPVLLRKHNTHFHFEGNCYVHGWMCGEMLESMGTDEEIWEAVASRQPFQIQ